jgi:hypothetical protein
MLGDLIQFLGLLQASRRDTIQGMVALLNKSILVFHRVSEESTPHDDELHLIQSMPHVS